MTQPDLDQLTPDQIANTDALADATLAELLADVGDLAVANPACPAEYERPGGRQRGDRIIRCHLPADHPGEHEEADTEVTWIGGAA